MGSQVCRAAVQAGHEVVSLSRRGEPTEESEAYGLEGVEWRKADATVPKDIILLVREVKPDAIVHCIGVLFDCNSLLYSYNQTMSGCGSVPDPVKGTYQKVIADTAMNAFHAIVVLNARDLPFVFISTCEVGWNTGENGILGSIAGFFARLVPSMHEYLTKKKEIEDAMIHGIGVPEICKKRSYAARPIVFRPSMVTTEKHPRSFLASLMSLSPFSDRPVSGTDLAASVLAAIEDKSARGVFRRNDIVYLAGKHVAQVKDS